MAITLVIQCQSLTFGGVLKSYQMHVYGSSRESTYCSIFWQWGNTSQPHHLKKPGNVFLWRFWLWQVKVMAV